MNLDPSKEEKHFLVCRIAIDNGMITKKQAQRALALQGKIAQAGRQMPISQILEKENIISADDAKKLETVVTRRMDKTFCGIAIERGFLSKDQAEQALIKQARIFKEKGECLLIGNILKQSGVLADEQIDTILQIQKRKSTKEPEAPPDQTQQQAPPGQRTEATGPPPPPPDKKSQPAQPDQKQKPQPAAKQKSSPAKGNLPAIIEISEDNMQAVLTLNQKQSLDHIKELLNKKEITQGIIDDSDILEFIEAAKPGEKLNIATGTNAKPGQDAQVQYNFDIEFHLKAGTVKDDGNIDFYEKGEVPKVAKDVVLAEKTPAIKEVEGVDIFGNTTPMPPASDITLRRGKGAEISEDRLRVVATTSGEPKLSMGGKFSVCGDHTLETVNSKTGHVDFDGNITVKKPLKTACRSRGPQLPLLKFFRPK